MAKQAGAYIELRDFERVIRDAAYRKIKRATSAIDEKSLASFFFGSLQDIAYRTVRVHVGLGAPRPLVGTLEKLFQDPLFWGHMGFSVSEGGAPRYLSDLFVVLQDIGTYNKVYKRVAERKIILLWFDKRRAYNFLSHYLTRKAGTVMGERVSWFEWLDKGYSIPSHTAIVGHTAFINNPYSRSRHGIMRKSREWRWTTVTPRGITYQAALRFVSLVETGRKYQRIVRDYYREALRRV